MKHFNESEKAYIDEVIRYLPFEKKEQYYNSYTRVKKESTLLGLIFILALVGGPLFYLKGNLNSKIIMHNVIYIIFSILYIFIVPSSVNLLNSQSLYSYIYFGNTFIFLIMLLALVVFVVLNIVLIYFIYVKNEKLYRDCIDDFNYNEKYQILSVIL